MIEIDWDKAPEHATHWCPGNARIKAVWIYRTGNEFYACYADKGLEYIVDFPDWRISRLIPRPSPAWNGEGLPPVGCECEVLNTDLSNAQWEKCTILFVGVHRILYDSESCSERVGYTDTLQFRPICTPEQIAAEEREAAVNEMKLIAGFTLEGECQFSRLYEAGYRKP